MRKMVGLLKLNGREGKGREGKGRDWELGIGIGIGWVVRLIIIIHSDKDVAFWIDKL